MALFANPNQHSPLNNPQSAIKKGPSIFDIPCSISGVLRKIVVSKESFVIKQISAWTSTKCVAMCGGCFYRSVFLIEGQDGMRERR